MVLDHGIEQGLRLYKEKIIRQRCEYWVSDEVRRSGIRWLSVRDAWQGSDLIAKA